MTVQVLVPPLGQTVDTLRLVAWYKREGETVKQGEPLFAVETDKATLDVEAPGSGVLREVNAQGGEEVKVLSAIAVIADREDAVTLRLADAKGPEQESVKAKELAKHGAGRQFVSPRARRLAEAQGIPVGQLSGTGPQGAVVERDVRAYLEQRDQRQPETAEPTISPVARRMADEGGLDWRALQGTGPRGQIMGEDVERALARGRTRAGPVSPAATGEKPEATAPARRESDDISLTGIRGVIAKRMAESHQQTAPVTLTTETDATALVALRKQLASDGVAVSYTDLLILVLAKALREHPQLNASSSEGAMRIWRRIDIGLAVDTDRGLLVPVLRDVAAKGLAELAGETQALTERARAGRCTSEELTGSTFTITNLGMFGIDAFTPIINLPECAILGVGRIKTEPVWIDDHVEPREKMWLSLTFDHRLVDGGPAARFLMRVGQLVEKPHLLLA